MLITPMPLILSRFASSSSIYATMHDTQSSLLLRLSTKYTLLQMIRNLIMFSQSLKSSLTSARSTTIAESLRDSRTVRQQSL